MVRAIARPAILPVDLPGLIERLRLTGIAVGYVLAAVPALVLAIATIVSLALSPVVVGALFLLAVVPALARFATWHRRFTAPLAGRDVPGDYRPVTAVDFPRRLLAWSQDVVRWRDLAFVAFAATGGWALALAVVTLAATPVNMFVQPWLVGGRPVSFLFWLLVPPAAALWWILTPILVKVRVDVEAVILGGSRVGELERRVLRVDAARAESIDHSAAELRRIERDLHDGAQARMVSVGMNLGLVEDLLRTDPAGAAALLEAARTSNLAALEDLRTLVRGIHPPVLADRGLAGAIDALVLDVALPVTVTGGLEGRAPLPVESAAYFAVAECLANAVRHARATRAWVDLRHHGRMLTVTVGDDGAGGADPAAGTGLSGIARRLSSFDGALDVTSPAGGPTTVTLRVPCELVSAER